MVEVNALYEGTLRCSAVHAPSQSKIETDAPTDNHGKGERFSPTDLLGTALGTCMITTMGIFAQRHDIDLTGTTVKVLKEMTSEPPRRIARLITEMKIPLPETHEYREALEKAALTCPVHLSLHPDIDKPLDIQWTG